MIPSRPCTLLVAALLVAALLIGGGPAAFAQATPDAFEGLIAWYRADDLTGGDDAPVAAWPDASGNGHDLTHDGAGQTALLKLDRLNGKPVVILRKSTAFNVGDPPSFRRHTMFVVAAARAESRALFRGAGTTGRARGVVLRGPGGVDAVWDGGDREDQRFAYGAPVPNDLAFHLLTLAGDGATLDGSFDGRPVGAGTPYAEPLQLASAFSLRVTTAKQLDAADLRLAEWVVFDRVLDPAERVAVETYLAGKYDLALNAPEGVAMATGGGGGGALASLGTSATLDVNGAGVVIPWNADEQWDAPFERLVGEPSRLVSGADGLRVRLYASLPLRSKTDGALVRLLFRVNGQEFIRGEGRSAALSATGPGSLGIVQAEAIVTLNAGDYVEVVTFAGGAGGPVELDSGGAIWIAEER